MKFRWILKLKLSAISNGTFLWIKVINGSFFLDIECLRKSWKFFYCIRTIDIRICYYWLKRTITKENTIVKLSCQQCSTFHCNSLLVNMFIEQVCSIEAATCLTSLLPICNMVQDKNALKMYCQKYLLQSLQLILNLYWNFLTLMLETGGQ